MQQSVPYEERFKVFCKLQNVAVAKDGKNIMEGGIHIEKELSMQNNHRGYNLWKTRPRKRGFGIISDLKGVQLC